jgi:hypothetical protein
LADAEAGGDGAAAAGAPGGGGGGGALALLAEPCESELLLPTLATDTTDVRVADLTRICALRGIGGSNPTNGPPCCLM